MAKPIRKEPGQVPTTGHDWDGIQELDNPMPRWWVWVFYMTIVWAIGYTIAYPAWPLLTRATPGILGDSTRADVAAEVIQRASCGIGFGQSFSLVLVTVTSPPLEATSSSPSKAA